VSSSKLRQDSAPFCLGLHRNSFKRGPNVLPTAIKKKPPDIDYCQQTAVEYHCSHATHFGLQRSRNALAWRTHCANRVRSDDFTFVRAGSRERPFKWNWKAWQELNANQSLRNAQLTHERNLALSLIGTVVREGRVAKTRHLGTRQAFAFAHLFRHLCRSMSRRVEIPVDTSLSRAY
jgi:hypothetical protein